ncbi:hypothetical protein [Acidocella aminolytica]|uniref:Lipoprotein n=1 Tax=Acidocella aminolytica 101 = DSM 11237 TaxID=1120923 RepID=A0A0D6PG55_9PROT|nr:hypothetical protein [Acidocella aminolytica]GAN79824.1 hypothetical protein Aam_030_057 [Acidocella aminolytica 101 = DSM 11237]GBQ31966.1 hypothetical protein AA11237_0024 [Acidocella aminolytica 101 = DSM 11237]SHF36191.1 hypothetical protein SAMN02746095_02976 [Acidocella aminolytica 101 = DSM 11237]
MKLKHLQGIVGAFLAVAVCVGLSACAHPPAALSVSNVPAPVTALMTTYMAADAGAMTYEALPACGAGQTPCKTAATVAEIKALDDAAWKAITPVVKAAETGQSVTNAAETSAAQAAVSAFSSYLSQHGVKN